LLLGGQLCEVIGFTVVDWFWIEIQAKGAIFAATLDPGATIGERATKVLAEYRRFTTSGSVINVLEKGCVSVW
jgi:hypothetical protein